MGTSVEIAVAGRDEARAREAIGRAFAAMVHVDREMAWSNPEGALGRLNQGGAPPPGVPPQSLASVILQALDIAKDSDGAFDPTIGAVSRLWDFENGGVVPDSAQVREALRHVGWMNVEVVESGGLVGFDLKGAQLDLGAIAKGYAIDRAVESLLRDGVTSGMVDAGGDLRLIGRRPGGDSWRIGVQDPRNPRALIARLELSDTAVVTSGDYERAFTAGGVSYHHILDPRTGLPARECRSVTVVAPTAAEADACATAAFVLGAERGIAFLRSRAGVSGMIVDASGGMMWTHERLLRASGS